MYMFIYIYTYNFRCRRPARHVTVSFPVPRRDCRPEEKNIFPCQMSTFLTVLGENS